VSGNVCEVKNDFTLSGFKSAAYIEFINYKFNEKF